MLFKRKSGRERRSIGKWSRIAVAGTAAAIGIGTIGVVGASAGHTTIQASSTCQTSSWSAHFTGSFYAADFIGLVRIRLLNGPSEATAQIPAAGYWDFASHPNPDPNHDFDHANIGTVDLTLSNLPLPQTSATFTFQANFVDLHLGVPGDPIEHPDTELVRTITVPQNCKVPPPSTTTTTAPTTTKPGEPAAVHAVTPLCISDAPFIDVTFGPQTQYTGLDAHISFIDVNGNVVGTHTAPYVPNGTVRLVYPGASVNAAGQATDWPGWKLAPNGNWIPDSSDQHLREGLTVRVEVNPTFEGQVSYPPETSGCASPHHSPASTLPPTGSNVPTGFAAGGLVFLGVGALAVLTTRRRAHQA